MFSHFSAIHKVFVQWLGVRYECSVGVGWLLGGVGVGRGCTNRILNSSLSTNVYFYLHHKFHRISSVTYERNTVRTLKGMFNIYSLDLRTVLVQPTNESW